MTGRVGDEGGVVVVGGLRHCATGMKVVVLASSVVSPREGIEKF